MSDPQRETSELEVVDNPELRRWEARSGGQMLGFAEYRLHPSRITFIHTEVDPAFEGRGIAGRLARAALDSSVARGLQIRSECPYISAYLSRHHEYDAHLFNRSARPNTDAH